MDVPLDSSFLCKRLSNFISLRLKLHNSDSPAMPYVHKPACYLEPQKLIEDMETKSSIVKSDQRCRAVEELKIWGHHLLPELEKGKLIRHNLGGLISLPCPPNPTALQRSSKHDKGPSKFDDQVNELYNKTMKINLRMIQIIFVKFQV